MPRYINRDKFMQILEADKWGFTDTVKIGIALDKAEEGVAPKSDVAREIFEEIEKYWIESDTLPDCARLVDLDKIAELKKKYTEN